MLLSNIFYALIYSPTFFNGVYPHLDERFFTEKEHIILFKKIKEYNINLSSTKIKQPKLSDLKLLIDTDTNISEKDTESVYEFIEHIKSIDRVEDEDLLKKKTEDYCKQRALENAILDSVEIIQTGKEVGVIEDKIKKALAVEFDIKIGTDFFKDSKNRYYSYIEEEEIIPTDIFLLNQLLNGGFRRKAIAAFLGRTNIGKSLILCHLASCFMKQGYNVLYVSAEMSETMIGRRIDANILDISANSLDKTLDKNMYMSKVRELYLKNTYGNLITKEYPTGGANALHIKNLITEIQHKKGYTPDVLVLDYLNIFGSHRLGSQAASNSYNYIKAVCEEMRGLAVEFNLALVTATQTNREGSNKGTEMGMDSISESFGTAMTLDWLCGINQTPEMFDERKYMFKNLKSRYDSNINQIVTVGIDYAKMRLLNLCEDEQCIPQHLKDKLKYEQSKIDNEKAFNDLDFT